MSYDSHVTPIRMSMQLVFIVKEKLTPSKVCPQCETNYCTTKAESVLLVSALLLLLWSSVYFPLRVCNACAFSDHHARAKAL